MKGAGANVPSGPALEEGAMGESSEAAPSEQLASGKDGAKALTEPLPKESPAEEKGKKEHPPPAPPKALPPRAREAPSQRESSVSAPPRKPLVEVPKARPDVPLKSQVSEGTGNGGGPGKGSSVVEPVATTSPKDDPRRAKLPAPPHQVTLPTTDPPQVTFSRSVPLAAVPSSSTPSASFSEPPPKVAPGSRESSAAGGDGSLSFGALNVPPPPPPPPRTFTLRPPGVQFPIGPQVPPHSFVVPLHGSTAPLLTLLPDTQTRSYSIPRGPPASSPLSVSRTHSWPTNGMPLGFAHPGPSTLHQDSPLQLDGSLLQGPRPRGVRPPQTLRISKWVNPIPPDPDDGQQLSGEQELATKMLQIQSKRFYIDVKQNRRGRFMKVAEIGMDGRRNQVFLALSTAAEFRDHLSMFSEFYSNLGPPNPDTLPEDGKLKSETMVKDNRRYYLDLKENSRGRFLRVSQTIARGGPRCQIAIPAQGMIEFRDALQELLEEFGTDDGGYKGELPEGRQMRVENKSFYFDIGQNNRGIYMRISEVKTNFRTAITIPEKSWSRFRDIFADYVDKMKEGGEKSGSESNK